jgi:hypothetical protein
LAIRALPYFRLPIAAATAPGFLTFPRRAMLALSAANLPPPPGAMLFAIVVLLTNALQ